MLRVLLIVALFASPVVAAEPAFDELPKAAQEFYTSRAPDFARIGGQVWYRGVLVKRDELRSRKAPSEQAAAYEHETAPYYVRLADGARAHSLEDVAAASPGFARIKGRVASEQGGDVVIETEDRGAVVVRELPAERVAALGRLVGRNIWTEVVAKEVGTASVFYGGTFRELPAFGPGDVSVADVSPRELYEHLAAERIAHVPVLIPKRTTKVVGKMLGGNGFHVVTSKTKEVTYEWGERKIPAPGVRAGR